MKTILKVTYILLITFAGSFIQKVQGQSVLDPNDPVITYDPAHPPAPQPAYGSVEWTKIRKWIRTKRMSWDCDSYKAYIYKGAAFRLKFPKSYNPNANDGKVYPMIIMMHGRGELGPITDNEYQLYHGGEVHKNFVDNGSFDGYVLFMQTIDWWADGYYADLKEIMDYMVINNKLDPFRVSCHGLSGGANGTWEMMTAYPTYLASGLPMSGMTNTQRDPAIINKLKFTPIWNFNGGQDASPAPGLVAELSTLWLANGAHYKNTLYPNLGHETWTTAYTEADFLPFILRANLANPWPLTGRTEYCPGDPISAVIGVAPGFDQYQWRLNGIVIPRVNTNQVTADNVGTYDCRVRRGTLWSQWSPIPVVIKRKAPTVSPNITVSGLMSKVIPALDGNNGVTLQVPTGYTSYLWRKTGSATDLGTTNTFNATTSGTYQVKVTELYGCSSDFSAPFAVVDANGPNKPDAAQHLIVSSASSTAIRLDWSDNPTPNFNETGFEIYQSNQPGGPYKLIAITAADINTYLVNGLHANTKYYYKIRAVNNTGAAAASNEGSNVTSSDAQLPVTPGNLRITSTNTTSISLAWDAATDDVGISQYFVYVNGVKSYVVDSLTTSVIATGLQSGVSYTFMVKAKDVSGNLSSPSNQVTSQAIFSGLNYKYYTGTFSNLPDYGTLTPVATGNMPNVAITPRTQDDNFSFLWEGFINIPVSGIYNFKTNSDDGSKLWLGALGASGSPYSFSGTAKVNNDGPHGPTDATSGALNLTAGVYPIAMAFFEQGGGEAMTVTWTTPSSAGNFIAIPNSAFAQAPANLGVAPAAPSALTATTATYKRINLNWTDNSSNETGFEIYRAKSQTTNFSVIAVAGANTTSYADTALEAGTTYYYKIKAIGNYGESDFNASGEGVSYGYYESTNMTTIPTNFDALTPAKSGKITTFNIASRNRDLNFAFKFSSYIYIPVAGTYTFYTSSDDGSKLYLDAFTEANLVVNNNYSQAETERSATKTLTAGYHEIYVTYYQGTGGYAFKVSYQGPDGSGILKQEIPASVLGKVVNATTSALPAPPAVPTALLATAVSSSDINVSWNDVSNETGFELYKSNNGNSNYILVATLAANTTSYADHNLFANAIYYYKVKAKGLASSSNYSNEDSAKTKNTAPVFTDPVNTSARFGVTKIITISASDVDGDGLTFTAQGLPAFATLINNGNKTASLSVSPTSAQQGVYSNITFFVNDGNGGKDTTSFTLTVNSNYDPVIDSIANYTVNENGSVNIPLTAIDQNSGDALTWTVSNLPLGYTLTPGANRSSTLTVNPGYGTAGTYTAQVNINDGAGSISTRSFSVTVNPKDPNTQVFIRIQNSTAIGAPWNSITTPSAVNLKDVYNNVTPIGISFPAGYFNTNPWGPVTGNNSGIYPDAVIKDNYYFGNPWEPQTSNVILSGLDPIRKYSLTFYAGVNWSGVTANSFTNYKVNGQTVSLYVKDNNSKTVSLNDLIPAADGTLTIEISKGGDAAIAFLNSIVLYSVFKDGTVPAAPSDLVAQSVQTGGINLSWQDKSYNETGFEVYRSSTENGTYTKVSGSIKNDVVNYTDSNPSQFTNFFYKVRAVNDYGASGYSNTFSIVTGNRVPTLTAINDVSIKNDQTMSVNVVASDDPADNLKLTVSNLPSFATFIDNGNGTGLIKFTPGLANVGAYRNITVTAKDNSNTTSSVAFQLTVGDKDVSSVYVNFSDGVYVGKAPWNNFSYWPNAGATMSGLLNDANTPSGITVTLQDGWDGANNYGMRPGNGTTIYDENVTRGNYITGATTAKVIKVTGLDNAKRYSFVFFNSYDYGVDGTTNFTVNSNGQPSQTVTLNATYNTNKTVQVNGIIPTAGQVTISVSKASGATIAVLGSMIIQSYASTANLLSPNNLRIVETNTNKVKLQWADRSFAETAFQVWRSTSAGGSFTLLKSLSPNITSYTDSALTSNKSYYYTVRAINGSLKSGFSDVVTTVTYAQNLFLNFTSVDIAPAPWNNTQATPEQGRVFNNFVFQDGQSTSIGMAITQSFSEIQPLGMNTGNNSGAFPDNVIKKTYAVFPGVTGEFKLTGLNLGFVYDIKLFGSQNQYNPEATSKYIVNGKTFIHNSSQNTGSGNVIAYGIVPDENGTITISVSRESSVSIGGYLCGIIVSGYLPNSVTDFPAVPASSSALSGVTLIDAATLADNIDNMLKAYPNPFRNEINLEFTAHQNDEVQVTVHTITGQLVYSKQFPNLSEGSNKLQIQLGSEVKTNSSLYLIRVAYINRKEGYKVIKLIKQP